VRTDLCALASPGGPDGPRHGDGRCFYVADGCLDLARSSNLLLATALAAGGTLALNQYLSGR